MTTDSVDEAGVAGTAGPETTPDPGPFSDLYETAVADLLDVPVTETWVDTGAGPTHVLLAGDEDAPPLLVCQGGNVTAPVTLAFVQALADDYRLVAPDTPGQPGVAETDEPASLGAWVVDVLDGLDLDVVPAVGISHGAGVLLEAAAVDPDRLSAAALVVPAGFGTRFSLALARVVVPSLAYRLLPRRWLLERALAPMFSAPVADTPEVVLATVGRALRTGDLEAGFPGPDGPAALAGFDAPALVVVGDGDPFFPAERTLATARTWLPSVAETVTLSGERHFLSPAGQARATEAVREFLTDQGAGA